MTLLRNLKRTEAKVTAIRTLGELRWLGAGAPKLLGPCGPTALPSRIDSDTGRHVPLKGTLETMVLGTQTRWAHGLVETGQDRGDCSYKENKGDPVPLPCSAGGPWSRAVAAR